MKKGFFTGILVWVAAIGIGALALPARAQDAPEVLWEAANQAYTSGDYASAIQLYDSIRQSGYTSARLYYNRGNASYKDRRIGEAVLYYNKALRLDPGNEDIRHNLAVANASVQDRIDAVPEFFVKTWIRRWMYSAGSDTWAVWSLIFLTTALALVLLYLLGSRMSLRKVGFYGAIGGVCLFVGSLVFAGIQRGKMIRPDQAVVMITAAPVKSEPNPAGRDLFVLHEGTRVRMADQVGEWREIVIADGNRGWIESRSIEAID
jgi:hypothetical protein